MPEEQRRHCRHGFDNGSKKEGLKGRGGVRCLTIVAAADGVRVDRHWAAGPSLILESGHKTAPSNCHAFGMTEMLINVLSRR